MNDQRDGPLRRLAGNVTHPARTLDRLGFAAAADRLRSIRWAAAALAPALRPAHAAKLTRLWLKEPHARRDYCVLTENQLLATRRSDTVFVFGSGQSLTELAEREWQLIGQHDVVGFSHFHRQRWIRADYHLIAEVASTMDTAQSIASNPLYRETIFGVMRGWLAEASNEMVAQHLLPPAARVFRWRRVGRGPIRPPSSRLADGLVHGAGSIQDAVNFALVLGWVRVVIVGVDLYGGYFWTPPVVDDLPGPDKAGSWAQADQVVRTMAFWREVAAGTGIELFVYSPRSRLASVLPVFEWTERLGS